MSTKRPDHKSTSEDDPALCRQVLAALDSLGWLPPRDESAVAASERELAGRAVPLPAELASPKAAWAWAWARGKAARPAGGPATLKLPHAPDVEAGLARAAREGGRLTPEIEEAMRRDRQAAEDEFDQHGPDVR
jgi:hypothetical protein